MRHISILLSVAIGLGGCAGSKDATQEVKKDDRAILEKQIKEHHRDLALQHFINGALYESKGEHANAILEYQDALRYDQDPAIHYAISKSYSILGKHALAAQHGREAVQLDSASIEYRENLALIFINAYQPDHAIREYEAILELDSYNTPAAYSLARLLQPNKPLQALEIYERLLDREGDKWDLLVHTAEILSALGKWKDAANRFERMLVIDPGNRPLKLQLAETYAKGGDREAAISLLEKMMDENDNDIAVVGALADIYLERGDFSRALALYTKLLRHEKNNPEVKLRIGIAYFGRIQSDSSFIPKAKEMFEDVRNLAPGDWRAHWYLGAIASIEQDDSLAALHFGHVLDLDMQNSEAWWFIGTYHFEKGELEQTMQVMERAIRALPNESRFYFLSGLVQTRLQKHEEAARFLTRALELKPDDLNALGTLALTYDTMKRHAQSDSLYERALELDPDSPLILNNYSYSLAERSLQLERALDMAREAVEAEPENSAYLDTLGWIYFKLGNYLEAERYIAKAISIGNASAVVVEHLGDVYFKLGIKEKATEYWQKALEMDTKNESLKEKIARGSL